MANLLTDADLALRLKTIRDCGSQDKAAAVLGIHIRNLQHSVKLAETRGVTADTVIVDEKERLRIQNGQLQRQINSLIKETDTAQRIREEIYKLSSRPPEPPKWLDRPGTFGSRGCPMTIWSDWHYGEVVLPAEVGGVNEFNADVAKKRVKRLVDTTIDLAFNHMGKAKTVYPGIVVCLGGDMISGDIHDELTATNDRTPQQGINDLTDILTSALDNIATKFGRVYVPCVVGNHGRSTQKPRMKGRIFTSHEWNIYCNVERYFRGNKNVVFDIPDETDVHFKVFGHRYLLTHGDSLGVKGGDGIIGSVGPIMRGSLKVARSEAQIDRDFDTVLMGHWHQYLCFPGVIVNNSLKGYDEFARLALRAPYSRPSQALWFTHPEQGITAHWQVYLEGLQNKHENKEWVSVQQRRA